jgi:hypothetical protein
MDNAKQGNWKGKKESCVDSTDRYALARRMWEGGIRKNGCRTNGLARAQTATQTPRGDGKMAEDGWN